ncbi:hypothetical protein M5K25_005754 [Dendrobium thyrsiflorum]|uniref:K-box domain-containing protein n=1 Tax=Dendrobium thyrsiflorum TaxID=117978 RepID=A0ABD0VIC0_DENTH
MRGPKARKSRQCTRHERADHGWISRSASWSRGLECTEDLCHEYEELKRKVDALQRSRRHVMGENLDTLILTDLQQLQLQLETALKHIRQDLGHIVS